MNHQPLLQQIIGVTLVALLLVACGAPAPTPTPIPEPQVGVPIFVDDWLFTIGEMSKHTTLEGFQKSWNAKEGHVFLVVNYERCNLSKVANSIDSRSFVLSDGEGITYQPKGTSSWGDYYDVGFASMVTTVPGSREDKGICSEEAYVFVVPTDASGPKLRIKESPSIPLYGVRPAIKTSFPTLGQEAPRGRPVSQVTRPEAGWISYLVQGGGGGLWLVDGDGGNARQVIDDIAYGKVKVSPDGTKLLIVAGPPVGWPSLYLVNADGTDRTVLVSNATFVSGDFSPDGQHIILRVQEIEQEGEKLYLADADGYNLKEISSGPSSVEYWFFPDGRLLLHRDTESTKQGMETLLLADPDGSNQREIASAEISADGYVTPDGQHLLVWLRDGDTGHLYLTDDQGEDRRELVKGAIYSWCAVSPDSERMLLAKRVEGEVTLYLADGEGGNRQTLMSGIEDVDFEFASDGQHTLLLVNHGQGEREEGLPTDILYIGDSQGGNLVEIKGGVDAYFSPDGSKVAYSVMEADGTFKLSIADADGSNAVEIGEGDINGWF